MDQVDMFLKLDGIKGESLDSKHKDEIQIESFSLGASQPGTSAMGGGTGGAGKVSVQDISITKAVDAATPVLLLHVCSGKPIKEGLITVRKSGETPLEYLKIKLSDIIVSSVQNAGHGSTKLSENVKLNFAKFSVTYTPQKADGSGGASVVMGWDIKQNVKS
jgi:type VI secretion system secreted protein Hcp